MAMLPAAFAEDHLVMQKDKAFSAKALSIKTGESVTFRNEDEFFHNIFSLSDPAPFDLGAFGKGQTRKLVFDQPGHYEVECAIHPEMRMTVNVSK
ncbi:plastocyanin/azurin family copper-binding protein [Hydrocarboniphaga sp.]|uniref:cupredoxin domain-containing protein n=1 Tax=Hydrocarboniphaga sp. TaxID=2033016 RepID=UPI00345715D3